MKQKADDVKMPFSWMAFTLARSDDYSVPIFIISISPLIIPSIIDDFSSRKPPFLSVLFLVFLIISILGVSLWFAGSISDYIYLNKIIQKKLKSIDIDVFLNIINSYSLVNHHLEQFLSCFPESVFNEENLEKLSKSQNIEILDKVAKHRNTNYNTLIYLTTINGSCLTKAFDSLNKRGLLNEENLDKLSKCENLVILDKIAEHQNTNNETLIFLAKKNGNIATKSFDFLNKREVLNEENLNKLSNSVNSEVLNKIAEHQNTNNETLIFLAKKNGKSFDLLNKRGLLNEENLDKLSSSGNSEVLNKIIEHKLTNYKTLVSMANGERRITVFKKLSERRYYNELAKLIYTETQKDHWVVDQAASSYEREQCYNYIWYMETVEVPEEGHYAKYTDYSDLSKAISLLKVISPNEQEQVLLSLEPIDSNLVEKLRHNLGN